MTDLLADALSVAIPGAIGFIVWRDVLRMTESNPRQRKMLFRAAAALTFNILLIWLLLAVIWLHLGRYANSEDPKIVHTLALTYTWLSIAGISVSLVTISLGLLSAHGLSRKICIWYSAAQLVVWLIANFMSTRVVAFFAIDHLLD